LGKLFLALSWGKVRESIINKHKLLNRGLGLLPLTIVLFVLTGCISTRTDNAFLLSLKNRGAVPLSSSNPFLAGNILLSKEMNRSPDLYGFVQSRGTPQALEVSKKWSGPATLQLYYLDKNEYYTAEESGSTWIVNGPQKIPLQGVALLKSLTEFGQKNAALELNPPKVQPTPTVTIPAMAKPPVQEPLAPVLAETTPEYPERSMTVPTQVPDSTVDPVVTRIKTISKGLTEKAELSPRGDIVHHVTYPGETLSIISRWYTLDVRNTGRIARINALNNPSQLDLGDTIIIPSYLVKNNKYLSEDVLKEIFKEISATKY
jgi:hypothetical protein